jgi:hypothetical protein
MKDPLTQLATKYGTDRHPGSKHSYTPYYYNLFKTRRNEIKSVLEIGVGEGAGLRMWQEFFPHATIYGAEIDPSQIFKEGRIQVIECDQSSISSLTELIKKTGTDLDFVVDDGSHIPNDQILSCQTLMPHLNNDVIYIIEDVADLTIIKSLGEYEILIPKLERRRKRYDDWLAVVKKP